MTQTKRFSPKGALLFCSFVFNKQRTVCIINVWGCAEILPLDLLGELYGTKAYYLNYSLFYMNWSYHRIHNNRLLIFTKPIFSGNAKTTKFTDTFKLTEV